MPIVTISDYSAQAPPYPATNPFSRQCPNFRTCFPGLSQSCNPFVSDRSLMLRRISFLSILFIRLVHTAFNLSSYRHYQYLDSQSLVFSGLDILSFFWLAWNLHLIVVMVGERKVMGVTFGRRAFDAFLWIMVLLHAGVVGKSIMEGVEVGFVVWGTLFLIIYLVAWVSTWERDQWVLSLV